MLFLRRVLRCSSTVTKGTDRSDHHLPHPVVSIGPKVLGESGPMAGRSSMPAPKVRGHGYFGPIRVPPGHLPLV